MTALSTDPLTEFALERENHRLRDRLRELLEADARYQAQLHARIAELTSQTQRHIHALEAQGAKVWPVHVRCDGCPAAVAFDPAPQEAEMAAALIALRWSLESGHRCPRCARRGLP